ncbi:winged helix-turn-helix transcriptional regulator [Natronosalvus halobius]|uniref:winged helix-turn-helix transcriptional regulator n=1 Tax=Natronosalvus halobius TaxID=2953746 RepID=UPI0020A1F7C9|nr:helix-turn-helix domain-containing protein [Natronosalvus halobius]USZ72516.1 helix-turn-helix transcriptional regulator [Natronosalvus halobius]
MADPDTITDALETILDVPATDALESATGLEAATGVEAATDVEGVSETEGTTDETTDDSPTKQDVLTLLERRHALSILRAITTAGGPSRFSELEDVVSASPNTLSARLSEFVKAGLLERTAYDEVPPRVEYEPTDAGATLAPLFVYLRLWESRYGDELEA